MLWVLIVVIIFLFTQSFEQVGEKQTCLIFNWDKPKNRLSFDNTGLVYKISNMKHVSLL